MTFKPLILIIDDVLDNVEVLGKSLSLLYAVQFATSGPRGLELIHQRRPDLVFLDVRMPEMDGYQVFSELRADPQTATIPVIFVTANNDSKSESDALDAGAVDFIHQPINPEVVRARARLHLELAKHRAHLEEMVEARTRELATARTEAETASAARSYLMANLSHEMRTPLHGILGFSELGKLSATPPEADYFELIEESARRMAQLVENLLTLVDHANKEDARRHAAQLQPIVVRDFVSGILHGVAPKAEQRKQEIVVEVATAVEIFSGDPERLRQVVEQLLDNALVYSPAGEPIVLRVSDAQLPGTKRDTFVSAIAFDLIDQGCGIPEAEMKAIFEPFYQSSRTATGAGGAGLGLPLSRCIVERHGGRLSIANADGKGAVVTMTLPLTLPQTLPLSSAIDSPA